MFNSYWFKRHFVRQALQYIKSLRVKTNNESVTDGALILRGKGYLNDANKIFG